MTPKILVIGGTGAQGNAIVHALSETGKYDISVLTRNTKSAAAQEVAKIPHVTLIEGDSSNADTLRKAFKGVDKCYVNTNGFALGEKDELFWGVKTFELAAEAGIKHYIWAGLPYPYKRSGYNPKYNVGHLDGKGRVTEFISAQPTSKMNWTVLNSCLYLEMLYENFRPTLGEDGKTYVFANAAGDGAVPMIALPDLAEYTKWVFENPEEARGAIIDAATEHVRWNDVAKGFTDVTGKPAIVQSITPRQFGEAVASQSQDGLETRFGAGGMKVADNFTGFMEVHSLAVPGTQGLWPVDYARLDKIFPGRVKSIGDWMKKVNYTGEDVKNVLRTKEELIAVK